jgi:multidrug efflux pump subunit AcrA (membrane-fusion protein)
VQLKFRELPEHMYAAAVSRFAHSLDLATRTMLTEIDIDNTRREIYPGMYANVTLDLERHAEALKLPASAVGHLSGDGHFVMVARGGHLEQVQVGIGISNGIYMEIVSGLTGKEEVVKALSEALSDGEPVETVLERHYHLGFRPEMAKSQ